MHLVMNERLEVVYSQCTTVHIYQADGWSVLQAFEREEYYEEQIRDLTARLSEVVIR